MGFIVGGLMEGFMVLSLSQKVGSAGSPLKRMLPFWFTRTTVGKEATRRVEAKDDFVVSMSQWPWALSLFSAR